MKQLKAVFLLSLFVFESFWPTAALGLTEAYQQPEFDSYEEFGSTDMVNIPTGDFTYSLPIVNIPSPEGGFQMPLSYHAGIEMDEESSWVGLGWGLNPGVLNRSPSIYPDDYDGSEIISDYANVPSLSGTTYIENSLFRTRYRDTHKGTSVTWKFGDIIGFTTSSASGVGLSLMGLSYNFKNRDLDFDVEKLSAASFQIAMLASPSGLAPNLFSISLSAISAISDAAYKAPQSSNQKSTDAFLRVESKYSRPGFFADKYALHKYYIDGISNYKVQGSLNLGNVSRTSSTEPFPGYSSQLIGNGVWPSGSTSNRPKILKSTVNSSDDVTQDMHVYYDDVPLSYQFNPSSTAYDNFLISAGGVSGQITPQRLDAGTFSDPVNSAPNNPHTCYSLTSFLPNKTNTTPLGYKVPFRYANEISNHYSHPLNLNGSNSPLTAFATDWDYQSSNYFQVNLNYAAVYNEDVTGGSAKVGKEANRSDNSLFNDKLVHGRHIDWYSNYEIINNQAGFFMDCGINRSTFPVNGIGGFSVTRDDGMTYHFTVPVYNKTEYKKVKKTQSNNVSDFYTVTNLNPFATQWLLTGITGADFVDRGIIGKIDDADWGYWVKLDYGMYNNNYLWRAPYFDWDVSKDGSTSQYRNGFKQTYYLNTIRTRTHTALFAKSLKNDGKSFYDSGGDGREDKSANSNEPTDETPTSVSHSLKLDDIYIVKNVDYDHIKNNLIPKWNFNYNNATNWAWAWDWNVSPKVFQIDNIDANVLLTEDLFANSFSGYNYLGNTQEQKIHFNYSYALCKGTFNSWISPSFSPLQYGAFTNISNYNTSNRTGKLTLESVDFLGQYSTRIMPNNLFNYDASNSLSNPDYSIYQKDDEGLYKPENTNGLGNTPHNPGPEGDQWSLKSITTPLGSVLNIQYERDTYSFLNGWSWGWMPLKVPGINVATNIGAHRIYVDTRFGNLNKFLTVGTVGYIKAPTYNIGLVNIPEQFFNFTISAIDPSGAYFDFTSTDPYLSSLCVQISANPSANSSEIGAVTGAANNPKYGGGLRVKSLSTIDEFGNKYVTQYDYNNSGVASYEPISNRVVDFEFYRYVDHPYAPIIYGNVKVSNGRMNGATFETNSSTTYKYTTPHYNMLNVDRGTTFTGANTTNNGFNTGAYYASYNMGTKNVTGHYTPKSGHIVITDNTSQIANLEEITNYNGRDEAISQTKFSYGTEVTNDMGIYGETNFIFELFLDPKISSGNNLNYTYRLFQTSKIKNNYYLKSITNNVGGVTSEMSILDWDPQTAKATKVLNYVGGINGEKYLSEYIPTYKKYPEMGSKVLNPNYKNIMTQNVQEKNSVYVTTSNSYKLLSSVVNTWANTHNYRLYDQPTGKYVSQPMTASASFIPPYHPHKEYVWKSKVDLDGTIKASDYVEFNWLSGTQDPRWIKTSEATLYSNYSKLLEGLDVNNKKTSIKYTHNQSYPIATLYNTGYGEWCFSSAEDLGTGNESNYFGGEVSETQYRYFDQYVTGLAHTGSYSLKVPEGAQLGFQFNGSFGPTSDFKPNKTYRASVWMHGSNLNGRLFCEIHSSAGGIYNFTDAYIAPGSVKEKYGSWYLLNLDVTMPALSAIPGTNPFVFFGCINPGTSGSGDVYFDDFRVQPLGAAFEATVTDGKTGNVVAKLDPENIATKFYYDYTNKLTRTQKETKNGFSTISTSSYNYKR